MTSGGNYVVEAYEKKISELTARAEKAECERDWLLERVGVKCGDVYLPCGNSKLNVADSLNQLRAHLESAKMTELKPCPNLLCGSRDVGGSSGKCYCYACGISTEQHETTELAVDAWNNRTAENKIKADALDVVAQGLGGAEGYLRYLYIDALNSTNCEIIYVPTEAGLPILEASRKTNKDN